MPKEEVPRGSTSSPSVRLIGLVLIVGTFTSIFGFVASSGTVAKITEELVALNETIQENTAQFSLVPFAEDPEEFRNAIEQWRVYLKEVGNMGTNAMLGPLEDNTLVPFLGNATIYAIFLSSSSLLKLLIPLCFFSDVWAATALALLLPPAVAGALAVAKLLATMAWVNQGLMAVVGDLRVGAMEKLLGGSNRNDEFLHLMLLATGHLASLDEQPLWLCLPLPPPLNLRLPTVKAASHGGAWTDGCVCVTWDVLSALASLLALLLALGVMRVVAAVRRGEPAPKTARVRIQE